ncbi:RND efflux system, outer membrane lipoprotein, NodT family [Methylobacterium sp. 4-46]|uniref:efflux transporter outer membrane subunit n=1 Tax=unclassified Methylobacterium TaxID=2615210 RepID=UPI000152CF8D|nr:MULTISPECIES: efflux transporter outer membrane subunit [Methylobacterium]ACA18760.1 RND efflux system, outer membrane lipoprotein, NodT family [Methylobacterium sp. 4-46]WFT77990.1 efflux transporter outer membrane subunit [Methylobacterium nodulans]
MSALPARIGAAILPPLLLGGCLVGPDYARPSVETPLAYKEGGAPATAMPGRHWRPARPRDEADRGDWWRVYRDPALDRMIRLIDVDNQSLRNAVAAYRQARALVQEARAQLFPTVLGAPGISRSRSAGIERTTLTLQGSASWELDLFGRVRRQIESDVAAAQASAADIAAVRLATQAELASTYFQLRYQESLQRLLDQTVQAYQRSLAIAENQYAAGVAARSDVITAQTQLQTTQAQAIAVGLQRAIFEHAIATLIGRPPSEVSLARARLAAAPPSVPVSLPSDLLERRPDVAAAERAVQRQSEQIGVAVAAFYPTVTLSANGGIAGDPARNFFSAANTFWSVAANGSQVLFDGGARGAALQAARAAYDANVATYRQTVLTAFQEVENGLSGQRILARQAAAQNVAVESSRRAVEIALNEYRAGTQNYTTVVTAQALALSNEVTALQILLNRFTNSVSLIRALGGGWDIRALPSGDELKGFRTLPIDTGQALRPDE